MSKIKNLSFVFVFLSSLGFSQVVNTRKIVDSLAAGKWNESSLVLDSLERGNLERINIREQKDIILHEDSQLNHKEVDQNPITPFALMRSYTPKRWFLYGQNNLLFNQSTFSNWNAGGNSSIGGMAKVNYSLVYKKNKHYLDTNFQFGYGMQAAQQQSARKTDDYVNILSNYGYDLQNNYYLSAGFQFQSQFAAGYNYSNTPKPTFQDRISKFMAPAYVNIGFGLLYNPKENFQIIFRPINGKFTFVMDKTLQKAGVFGMTRNGQDFRVEAGPMLNAIYKWQIIKDMNFTNQLNLFTSYANHFERVDVAYSGILNVKFNRFVSTVVTIDLVYDHDQVKKLQTKQTLGVGFSHSFGTKSDGKPDKIQKLKPFL